MKINDVICIVIAFLTQSLNILAGALCIIRGDYIPSIVIGMICRIVLDGGLLYYAWKGINVCRYLLLAFWLGTSMFAFYFTGKAYYARDHKEAFLLLAVGIMYIGFSFLMMRATQNGEYR